MRRENLEIKPPRPDGSVRLALVVRRVLAGLLAAAGAGYAALLVATYQHTTPPSALAPTVSEVGRLLFVARPIGPLERRLDASDTPLGTGPLITGQSITTATSGDPPADERSMRFAFIDRADGREKSLTAQELAEREGERQALLDWIRGGASRTAYEQDSLALRHPASVKTITPAFLRTETSGPQASSPPRVRIRSLINERCVSCHNEEDGDDTARLVPFDTYEGIARYLVPDDQGNRGRPWLLAAIFSVFPLALLVGPVFSFTSHRLATRRRLLAVTTVALIVMSAGWFAGAGFTLLLLVAALVVVMCLELQVLASVVELLGIQKR